MFCFDVICVQSSGPHSEMYQTCNNCHQCITAVQAKQTQAPWEHRGPRINISSEWFDHKSTALSSGVNTPKTHFRSNCIREVVWFTCGEILLAVGKGLRLEWHWRTYYSADALWQYNNEKHWRSHAYPQVFYVFIPYDDKVLVNLNCRSCLSCYWLKKFDTLLPYGISYWLHIAIVMT